MLHLGEERHPLGEGLEGYRSTIKGLNTNGNGNGNGSRIIGV